MQGKDRNALRRDQTWEAQDWLIAIALMNRVCECATQMQEGGIQLFCAQRHTLSKALMLLNKDRAFQILRTERMSLCYIIDASIAEAPLFQSYTIESILQMDLSKNTKKSDHCAWVSLSPHSNCEAFLRSSI